MDTSAFGVTELARGEQLAVEGGDFIYDAFNAAGRAARAVADFVEGWWDAGMSGGK